MGASTIVASSAERYLGADIISGWVPRCESGSGRGARLGLVDDVETRRTQGVSGSGGWRLDCGRRCVFMGNLGPIASGGIAFKVGLSRAISTNQ
jgi:hypothetical protein